MLALPVAVKAFEGFQDSLVVCQAVSGFSYDVATFVREASGALVDRSDHQMVTFGNIAPWMYLVHPVTSRLFPQKPAVHVVLFDGGPATVLDVW